MFTSVLHRGLQVLVIIWFVSPRPTANSNEVDPKINITAREPGRAPPNKKRSLWILGIIQTRKTSNLPGLTISKTRVNHTQLVFIMGFAHWQGMDPASKAAQVIKPSGLQTGVQQGGALLVLEFWLISSTYTNTIYTHSAHGTARKPYSVYLYIRIIYTYTPTESRPRALESEQRLCPHLRDVTLFFPATHHCRIDSMGRIVVF